MTREQIVIIMRKELRRQYEEGDLGYFTDDDGSVCIDGYPDLGMIADAILSEIARAGVGL